MVRRDGTNERKRMQSTHDCASFRLLMASDESWMNDAKASRRVDRLRLHRGWWWCACRGKSWLNAWCVVFKRLLPVDACLISSLPITGTALLIHAARCTLHAPAAGSRVMTQSGGGGRLPHFPLFLVTSHRESITCCCCYRRNATNRKQSVAMQSAKSMQSPSVLLTDDDDDDDGIMLNVVLYHQVLTKREKERFSVIVPLLSLERENTNKSMGAHQLPSPPTHLIPLFHRAIQILFSPSTSPTIFFLCVTTCFWHIECINTSLLSFLFLVIALLLSSTITFS